jgi:hypothetical protein
MELYYDLDLHSLNTYVGILNPGLKRVFKKRVSNNLDLILETFQSFKDQLKGFAVDSNYNWSSLVDGLMGSLQWIPWTSVPHLTGQNTLTN